MRRRIVLLASGAVALAIVLAASVTYVVARAELRGGVDDALRQLAVQLQVPPPGGVPLRVPLDPLGGATGAAAVVGPEGVEVGPAFLPATQAARDVADGTREEAFTDATIDGTRVRVFATRGPLGDALQVVRPLTEVDEALADLRLVLTLVTLGGIALAAGLGWLVSRAAIRPVVALTTEAEQVAATRDLSRRVPAGGRDELARLGGAFNVMLGALERSQTAQKRLVADASHELRTPLTSVRTNVEHLVAAPDLPPEERRHVLAQTRAQLEDLSLLVGDLVDLARDEPPDLAVEEVRLDLLVEDAVARARRHAPRARFVVDAAPCAVDGVPSRLHRALGNLLDNAVTHGPPDGEVQVTVRDATVVVRDHGAGIAAGDLPHVFDRFFRAAGARGRPGSGLGLAIVRQVAEEHGGSVAARPAEGGGAELVLALPVAVGSPTS